VNDREEAHAMNARAREGRDREEAHAMNARAREGRDREEARDAWIATSVALVARLAIVAWAAGRFPPAGDGSYYDTLARRIAHGDGYTWLWPDGAVTYAAHYPVGYPALVAAGYALFGADPWVAMLLNAILGAIAARATYALAREASGRRGAMGAALVVALHPALVPYTAALMTEGVASSLLVMAAALAMRARAAARPITWWAIAGIALGGATLVRPQCIALAPLLGLLAVRAPSSWKGRAGAAAIVTAAAIACCAPWTARNCVRMHRCALVSVNGGWNLLIGTQTTSGAWAPVDVPDECKTVWDEAGKDACFEAAARRAIARAPGAWVGRAEAKLAATFDYFGAAPWYLHLSSADAFGERAKTALGALETIVNRLLLLFALLALARVDGPRIIARRAFALAGALAALTLHAWIAYLALAAGVALLGARALARAPLVVPWTAITIAATAALHAVFFGAGRYGLVVVPFVSAFAFVRGKVSPPLASESRASSASSGSSS
jgi:4-amino-4-deoxy-L-arabinose transferase-like glycosyltransferase